MLDLVRDVLVAGAVQHNDVDGGETCFEFVPMDVHIEESLFALPSLAVTFLVVRFLLRNVEGPQDMDHLKTSARTPTDIFLGTVLLLVYIIEFGYKVVSHKVLYMLQPCHMVTLMQIVALWAPSWGGANWLVAQMMGWMFGPLLAVLKPDTSCLRLPCEVEVFWIQHLMIVVIVPIYLLCRKGPVGVPRIETLFQNKLMWIEAILSCQLFHWFVLHPLGHLTWVNLNYMLCPPPGMNDFFSQLGPLSYYRSRTSLTCVVAAFLVMLLYKYTARILSAVRGVQRSGSQETKKKK